MNGKITELKQNDRNFFFKIDGDKRSFSGYGQANFKSGDQVEFNVSEKDVNGKVYYNAKDIELVSDDPRQSAERTTEVQLQEAAELAVQLQIKVNALCELNKIEGMDKAQALVTARQLLGLGA